MADTDRELLFSVTSKDLTFQTFTVSGAGGQHRDRAQTGVRFIHEPSGARGESREFREQKRNKHAALVKLTQTPSFKFWVAQRVSEIDKKQTAEQWVAAQLADLSQIKIEYRDADGKWIEADQ